MVFFAPPLNSKCEWRDLQGFIRQYSAENGLELVDKICLDVENRSKVEPELLLKYSTGKIVVIERKSIVWPENFLSEEANGWLLANELEAKIGKHFADQAYELHLSASALRGKSKKQVRTIADLMVGKIIPYLEVATSEGGLGSKEPFPWWLGQACDFDDDPTTPKQGIGVIISDSADRFYDRKLREAAKVEYESRFQKAAISAAKKLAQYPDAVKIFVVQFHGYSDLIFRDDLLNMIKLSTLPSEIDEIWYADEEPISEYECRVIWVRGR